MFYISHEFVEDGGVMNGILSSCESYSLTEDSWYDHLKVEAVCRQFHPVEDGEKAPEYTWSFDERSGAWRARRVEP